MEKSTETSETEGIFFYFPSQKSFPTAFLVGARHVLSLFFISAAIFKKRFACLLLQKSIQVSAERRHVVQSNIAQLHDSSLALMTWSLLEVSSVFVNAFHSFSTSFVGLKVHALMGHLLLPYYLHVSALWCNTKNTTVMCWQSVIKEADWRFFFNFSLEGYNVRH